MKDFSVRGRRTPPAQGAKLGRVLALASASLALVACSSDEAASDGSLRGTLAVHLVTMDDGTSRTEYRLFVDGGERDARELVFENPPELDSGSELEVWGEPSGEKLVVRRFELNARESPDGLETSEQTIINGPPYATRTLAYVLVDIGGGSGSYSEAQASIDVFGTGAGNGSLKQWLLENSYGRQDITGDVVTGLRFPMSGCNYTELTAELRPQVIDALGMSAQNYLWQFRTRNSSCGWSGVASVGSAMTPRLDTWFNAATGCTVLVQEPLHNFGMQHSSSLRCSGTPFANNPSNCTHSEYGDPYDPLGSGCRHTNAWQKGYVGWFGGCNRVRVNQSGPFTLHPLEVPCNGIQVLQVPMPVTTRTIPRSGGGGGSSNDPVQFYYLELRTRTGFDQEMTNAPVVLVHVGPDYRARNISGMHTWILDMNPSTEGFDGMSVGQTFDDPAGGVSFTVEAANASSATIDVTVPTNAPSTCADGGVLPSPGGATTCNGGVGAGGGAGTGAATSGSSAGGGRGGAGGRGASGGASAGLGGVGAESGTAGSETSGNGGLAGNPSAGSTGIGGAAGSAPVSGAAGAPAAGSATSPGPSPEEDAREEAGCGCRIPTDSRRSDAAFVLAMLGAIGASLRRRRGR